MEAKARDRAVMTVLKQDFAALSYECQSIRDRIKDIEFISSLAEDDTTLNSLVRERQAAVDKLRFCRKDMQDLHLKIIGLGGDIDMREF